jgi:hypothetical protein
MRRTHSRRRRSRRIKAQDSPTATHLQSQVETGWGAMATVAPTSLTIIPSRTRIIGGQVLQNGNDDPHPTLAQRTRSASTILSRGLPNIDHAPSPISTIQNHTPLLVERVNYLRRHLRRHKPWIQRRHLTTVTWADYLVTSYQR